MLASVGHFQEKFILGLQYRGRGAGEAGGEINSKFKTCTERSRSIQNSRIKELLPSGSSKNCLLFPNAQCPMPNAQ
ncbi:hypothetical protein [Nostoc sp. CHAB 5715]|uniref:hypothetical protein n=1 Tax=Nostoc sp. CHAB 5715 TaxID=2780400 RepID=UPI001E42D760|nr:hypothetical protein [Nostoc sp. CHAB 5715]MCC5625223.1 hypothetical protein [Nostoc sp. CHAB 5715]